MVGDPRGYGNRDYATATKSSGKILARQISALEPNLLAVREVKPTFMAISHDFDSRDYFPGFALFGPCLRYVRSLPRPEARLLVKRSSREMKCTGTLCSVGFMPGLISSATSIISHAAAKMAAPAKTQCQVNDPGTHAPPVVFSTIIFTDARFFLFDSHSNGIRISG